MLGNICHTTSISVLYFFQQFWHRCLSCCWDRWILQQRLESKWDEKPIFYWLQSKQENKLVFPGHLLIIFCSWDMLASSTTVRIPLLHWSDWILLSRKNIHNDEELYRIKLKAYLHILIVKSTDDAYLDEMEFILIITNMNFPTVKFRYIFLISSHYDAYICRQHSNGTRG